VRGEEISGSESGRWEEGRNNEPSSPREELSHAVTEDRLTRTSALLKEDKEEGVSRTFLVLESDARGDSHRDPFPLSSRNSSNVLIPDDGFSSVFEPECLEENIEVGSLVLRFGLSVRSDSRSLHLESELKGLGDRENGVVGIILGVEDDLTRVL